MNKRNFHLTTLLLLLSLTFLIKPVFAQEYTWGMESLNMILSPEGAYFPIFLRIIIIVYFTIVGKALADSSSVLDRFEGPGELMKYTGALIGIVFTLTMTDSELMTVAGIAHLIGYIIFIVATYNYFRSTTSLNLLGLGLMLIVYAIFTRVVIPTLTGWFPGVVPDTFQAFSSGQMIFGLALLVIGLFRNIQKGGLDNLVNTRSGPAGGRDGGGGGGGDEGLTRQDFQDLKGIFMGRGPGINNIEKVINELITKGSVNPNPGFRDAIDDAEDKAQELINNHKDPLIALLNGDAIGLDNAEERRIRYDLLTFFYLLIPYDPNKLPFDPNDRDQDAADSMEDLGQLIVGIDDLRALFNNINHSPFLHRKNYQFPDLLTRYWAYAYNPNIDQADRLKSISNFIIQEMRA